MKTGLNNCSFCRIVGIGLLIILLLPFLGGCSTLGNPEFTGTAVITASSSNLDPVHVSFTGQTSGAPRVEPGESITLRVETTDGSGETLTLSRGGRVLQTAIVGFYIGHTTTTVHIQETSYNSFNITSSR